MRLTKLFRIFKVIPLKLMALIVGAGIVAFILLNPAKARKSMPVEAPVTSTEGIRLKKTDHQVVVESYGSVTPHSQGRLVSQVAGEIVQVSPSFKNGGFIKPGEVLLIIDPFDAQQEVSEAKAVLQELSLKNAGHEQLMAAENRLKRAEKQLEETQIIAPYEARILSISSGLGFYVNKGATVAEIAAVDYVEVPLPLNSLQLSFLQLPETYQDQPENGGQPRPKVEVVAEQGTMKYLWTGTIERTGGVIDTTTRTLNAYARIEKPYAMTISGQPPLKIGQFVKARIYGQKLTGVFEVPRTAVYREKEVLLEIDGLIQRREVGIIWSTEAMAIVNQGLNEGEVLITTPLGGAVDGLRISVKIDGEEPAEKPAAKSNKNRPQKNNGAKPIEATNAKPDKSTEQSAKKDSPAKAEKP